MPWMVFVNKCYINLFFSSSSEPELARLLPFQAQTFGQTAYLKSKEKETSSTPRLRHMLTAHFVPLSKTFHLG
jgi:hypothetical protein